MGVVISSSTHPVSAILPASMGSEDHSAQVVWSSCSMVVVHSMTSPSCFRLSAEGSKETCGSGGVSAISCCVFVTVALSLIAFFVVCHSSCQILAVWW